MVEVSELKVAADPTTCGVDRISRLGDPCGVHPRRPPWRAARRVRRPRGRPLLATGAHMPILLPIAPDDRLTPIPAVPSASELDAAERLEPDEKNEPCPARGRDRDRVRMDEESREQVDWFPASSWSGSRSEGPGPAPAVSARR